jgi:hypothetical protein
MVFFEEGTRRLFAGEDPPTLSSLIYLMPDISYDYALKNLRGTAHEVSWLHKGLGGRDGKKDLVWDDCKEAIAAGMSVSKAFRLDCSMTLGVFVKLMFQFKIKTHGTDMQCEGSEDSDSLGGLDMRSREDAGQISKEDATEHVTAWCNERETPNPGIPARDEPTTG